MADWGQLKQDVLAGMASLTAQVARAAQRAGRELTVLESRTELAKIERELARRYRELGEAAYEEWRRAGALTLHEPAVRECVETVVELMAQRDQLKRDLSEHDEAAHPSGAP